MKRDKTESDEHSFLFKVEILVNADTNGEALEQLLRALNGGGFADFRIESGIQLGKVIETALAQNKKAGASPSVSVDKDKVAAAVAKAKAAVAKSKSGEPAATAPASKKAAALTAIPEEVDRRIRQYMKENKLIRFNVNKGRGVKLSIPGRIIGFDSETQMLTVYHVDEKQVHSFKLFEIDDFLE